MLGNPEVSASWNKEIKIKQQCRGVRVNDAKLETGSPEILEHLLGCQVALALVRPAVYLVKRLPNAPLLPQGTVHCFTNNRRAEAKT